MTIYKLKKPGFNTYGHNQSGYLNPKCDRSITSGIPKILSRIHSRENEKKEPSYYPRREKTKIITEEVKNGYPFPNNNLQSPSSSPFCVSAEHSRYLTAPTSFAIARPCVKNQSIQKT
jgi:hypothetical protein